MEYKFIISFLLFCLVSISLSQEGPKTCPVEFTSSGTCAGSFGISECYHESMAKYGPIPPSGCRCIPNGVVSRICSCNVVCHQIHFQPAALPPNAAAAVPTNAAISN